MVEWIFSVRWCTKAITVSVETGAIAALFDLAGLLLVKKWQ